MLFLCLKIQLIYDTSRKTDIALVINLINIKSDVKHPAACSRAPCTKDFYFRQLKDIISQYSPYCDVSMVSISIRMTFKLSAGHWDER